MLRCLEGLNSLLTTLQEEPEDYPFPLTLKTKNKGADGSGTATPTLANGNGNTALPDRGVLASASTIQ